MKIWTPSTEIIEFKNPLIFEQFRDGELIDKEICYNGIVTVGKNSLLDVAFRAQTQLTAWYVSLINNSGFSALADADTMSSHAGWTEFTSYDESTRVQWSPGAAAAGAITNASAMTFTINATGTLYGAFITSGSAKSGTAGTLWATAAFNTAKPVSNGDEIKITYTVSC